MDKPRQEEPVRVVIVDPYRYPQKGRSDLDDMVISIDTWIFIGMVILVILYALGIVD